MKLRQFALACMLAVVPSQLPECGGMMPDMDEGPEMGAEVVDADQLQLDFAKKRRDLAVQVPPDFAVPVLPDLASEGPRDLTGPPVADLTVPPPPDLARPPVVDMASPPPPGVDRFGVKMLYPTTAGGREWYLPDNANVPAGEWQPSASGTPVTVTKVSAGVFSVSGAPRMTVVSPPGKAWWRNVEMTEYVYETGTVDFYADQVPHWDFFVRGEMHDNSTIPASSINLGVPAPPGTAAWPGYPFSGSINRSCVASAYHMNWYLTGQFNFEKEITHTQGYGARNAGQTYVSPFANPLRRWFGAKFIVRNMKGNTQVTFEGWIDENNDGNWKKVTSASDTGSWLAGNSNLNGCTVAPFRYTTNQVITWAGPWAAFRMDNLSYQFQKLSVREIDPLP